MPRKMYSMRFAPSVVAAFDKSAAQRGLDRTTAMEKLMRAQAERDGYEVEEPDVSERDEAKS